MATQSTKGNIFSEWVRTVEDFPKPGICFYDVAPLLGNGAVFGALIEEMSAPLEGRITKVVGFDARGFLFGGAMAARLGVGFAMLRKPGKLPGAVERVEYDLEYGSNELEIQEGAIATGEKIALVDDLIATGGTALAGVELVRRQGTQIVEFTSVIDIEDLGGSQVIRDKGVPVRSMLSYGACS